MTTSNNNNQDKQTSPKEPVKAPVTRPAETEMTLNASYGDQSNRNKPK